MDAGGTEIVVSFDHAEDVSAADSSAVLPEPFTLTLPDLESDAELARGNDLSVGWDAGDASGEVDWEVEGDCIWTESGSSSDDGSLTISADDIRVQSLNEGESCTLTVTVERRNIGSVDPAFEEGGRFTAI